MSEDTSSPQPPAEPPKPAKWPKWAKAYLAGLRATGSCRRAAELAKVNRHVPPDWIHDHPGSGLDVALAQVNEEYADRLEEEADRRGREGTEEPVYGRVGKDQDGQIGTIRKYSDVLLIFRLKALRPDKYRERFDHKLDVGKALDELSKRTGLPPQDLLDEARRLTGEKP